MAVRKAPIVHRDLKPVNREHQLQPPVPRPSVEVRFEPPPADVDYEGVIDRWLVSLLDSGLG